jgi:hypothetical protein
MISTMKGLANNTPTMVAWANSLMVILHSPLRKARSQGDLDRGSHGGWQGLTDTGGGGSLPLSCSQGLIRQVAW